MTAHNILRGQKWAKVRADAVFHNYTKDIAWMDSQPEILKDIEAYNLSLDPNTDINFSGKTRAELRKACDEAEIAYTDKSTKDQLIVLLENKSKEPKAEPKPEVI